MKNRYYLLIFSVLITWPAYSEVFKWVDAQGNTHYGDKPADKQTSTQINVAAPETKITEPQLSEERDERRRRLADAMQEDRLKKKEEKEKKLQQQQQLNKQCIYARDQLRQYEDSGYLYQLDKDGNRITMSDEQRQSSIDKYRANIKKHCGN
ncbi:MAG: hypothetical protein QG652_1750 [Pseudomonadota bacterium]|nr:hypothetical protein [Pseudomonadota bacterium]